MSIYIIGSGMAGFGAAYQLDKRGYKPTMFEMKNYHGGHAASFDYGDGFIFDDGPHISFTKNERIQKLFAESIGQEFEVLNARVNNYWRGYWIKHPAQVNLHGLPEDLVKTIILEMIENKYSDVNGEPENYKQWLYRQFGETFTETFPMVYGKKYHTTDAENMSIDWLGNRLYQPDLSEVLTGALRPDTPDVHYVDHFRYPSHNGFVSFLDMFLDKVDLKLNHEVTEVDPKKKQLVLKNGKTAEYSSLISTIPLPELIPMIREVPADVVSAASKLACTSCILVNIGIDRDDISESQWSYFYDTDIIFTRISYPYKFSPNNTPQGAGSIQVEVYFSDKYKPLKQQPEDFIKPVIRDLKRTGLLKDENNIIHTSSRFVKYANVIFDLDRTEALKVINGYLEQQGIETCGRYGEWGYHWTDEAFVSGEDAATNVLKKH